MLNLETLYTMNSALESLYNDAVEAARKLGAVINGESAKDIDIAKADADAKRDAFNEAVDNTAYASFLQSETPMLTMLTAISVAQFRYTVKNSNKTGKSVEWTCEQVFVDIEKLDNYAAKAGKRVTVKIDWRAPVAEAHKIMCGFIAADMNDDAVRKQFMKDFDILFNMGAKTARSDCGFNSIKDRYSKNAATNALQAALDAVIYDDASNGGKNRYRVHKNLDVSKIEHTIATARNLTVKFPKFNQFVKNAFTPMCIRIVNDMGLEFDYPVSK